MSKEMLILIVGMALAAYLTRAPLMMLSADIIPPLIKRWLRFVPPAMLSALIAPVIFIPHQRVDLSLENHYLIASVVTGYTAYRTKNLLLTIIIGVGSVVLLRWILGGS